MGERERRCAVRCVCEVVVGDARVAVANGGNDGEGREPLSVSPSQYVCRDVSSTRTQPRRALEPSFPPPASTGPTRSDSTAGAGTTALTK